MLEIKLGATRQFDDSKQEFVMAGGVPLRLEHSLVSLSKWESIHEKPFLANEDKTQEEIMSYVECMILSTDYPADWQLRLSKENIEEIDAYIWKQQALSSSPYRMSIGWRESMEGRSSAAAWSAIGPGSTTWTWNSSGSRASA